MTFVLKIFNTESLDFQSVYFIECSVVLVSFSLCHVYSQASMPVSVQNWLISVIFVYHCHFSLGEHAFTPPKTTFRVSSLTVCAATSEQASELKYPRFS